MSPRLIASRCCQLLRATALAVEALLRMAVDAAAGLEYLACRRIVHRDIAARNCLVDAQHTVKLTGPRPAGRVFAA